MNTTRVANSETFAATTPADRQIVLTRRFDAPPRLVFEALTKPEHVRRWWGCLGEGYSVPVCEIDLRVGGAWRIVGRTPEGPMPAFYGVYREIDPPRRLVQTMRALWGEDVKAEGTSRVTWEIEQVEDSCRLTVTHDQLREGANEQLYGGWPMILSGLKTWLETGETLTTPGSIMYTR